MLYKKLEQMFSQSCIAWILEPEGSPTEINVKCPTDSTGHKMMHHGLLMFALKCFFQGQTFINFRRKQVNKQKA